MRIPFVQNLRSKSYNSEIVELVWLFPNDVLFIFGYIKDKGFYMETGQVNETGQYITEPNWVHSLSLSQLCDPGIWSQRKPPEVYNNFSNGQDLVELGQSCIDYLK